MSARGNHRMRVVPPVPPPPMVRSVSPADWDDDPDAVDFQDEMLDDTVNVAAKILEDAATAEKQGTMTEGTTAIEGTPGREQSQAQGQGHEEEGTQPAPGSGPMRIRQTGPGAEPPPFELAAMIRVAKSGVVVTNKGGSEDLAGVVAYAHRLVDLVGDLLGLERFRALECVFKTPEGGSGGGASSRCLLFAEENGDTVLVRPRAEGELQALRERLGV